MSELPSGPWKNLSADFCGPLETGDYLFVVIDEYSRYPVVEIVKSVSANTVIPVLEKIIAMFGVPTVIKTDNGSPFNSNSFANYVKYCGFVHRKITPRWPRANAQAESFNKPLMKCVKSAYVEGKNWKQELYRFLRQYRATPHTSTGYTPFQLLFQREATTRLPEITKQETIRDRRIDMDEIARQNDERSKSHSKTYQDKKNHARKSEIDIGDKVLIQNEMPTKTSSKYKPIPYTVKEKKGPMISVENNSGHRVTRNSSMMKKINPSLKGRNEDEGVEDEPMEINIDSSQNRQEDLVSTRPVRERRAPARLSDYVWNVKVP